MTDPWSTNRSPGIPMSRTATDRYAGIGEPRLLDRLEHRGPEPAGHDALLERHEQRLAPRLVEDQLAVERLREPRVDHADGPAARLQRVGHLERAPGDRPEGHEQQVAALAEDLAAPDGDRLGLALRHAEPGVARVVERERVVLGERRPQQRAQLLLVARAGDDEVRQLRWAGSVNMPWWLVPSSPTRPARSTASSTGASFWHTSWTVWSNARWRNVE